MKLWTYWMDNDYHSHYEERLLPPGDYSTHLADFEEASKTLHYRINNGEIKDYRVELRK